MEGAFVKRGIVEKLKGKIQEAEENKQKLLAYIHQLKDKVVKRELSYSDYEEALEQKRKGKTLHEWLDFYQDYIKNCEKKISEHKKKKTRKKILISFYAIFTLILLVSIAAFIRPALIGYAVKAPSQELSQPINLEFSSSQSYAWNIEHPGLLQSVKLSGLIQGSGQVKIYLDDLLILDSNNIKENQNPKSTSTSPITGFAVGDLYSEQQGAQLAPSNEPPVTENTTETTTGIQENITPETPAENITQPEENITQPQENITIIKEFSNICEETCNLGKLALNKSSYTLRIEITNAKLNLDQITYEIGQKIPENITPEIPTNITNITIENITNATGIMEGKPEIGKPVKWKARIKAPTLEEGQEKLPKKSSLISGQEVSTETYDFEYETPAPQAIEEATDKGKIITITSEINYTGITTYTSLPQQAKADRIKLYKITESGKQPVQFTSQDTDNNSLIDEITWDSSTGDIFELIIEISKAEHLDENKIFISDIYEQVKSLDDIWSEEIKASEYVRVTFNQKLTNKNDITIFPKIISGTPRIEVYEIDSQEKIAEFSSLNPDENFIVLI